MGILSGNPKEEPMHYGEVFAVWSALSMAKAQVVAYEILYNHAGDKDLKKFIEDVIRNTAKPAVEEIESLLKANGVGMPPSPPERPEARRDDIPVGAHIMDPEIAATISKDIAQGLIADSGVIGLSIREDIAFMFVQFHTKKVQMGAKLLQMIKEKGWLIHPPLHVYKTKED